MKERRSAGLNFLKTYLTLLNKVQCQRTIAKRHLHATASTCRRSRSEQKKVSRTSAMACQILGVKAPKNRTDGFMLDYKSHPINCRSWADRRISLPFIYCGSSRDHIFFYLKEHLNPDKLITSFHLYRLRICKPSSPRDCAMRSRSLYDHYQTKFDESSLLDMT